MSTFSIRTRSSAIAEHGAPLRLSEGGGTDYERQLLASASRDGVPAAAMANVAANLREAVAAQARGAGEASLPGARAAGPVGAARNVRPWVAGAAAGIVGAGVVAAVVASVWDSRATAERAALVADGPVAVAVPVVELKSASVEAEPASGASAAAAPVAAPSPRSSQTQRSAAPRAPGKVVRGAARTNDARVATGAELGLAAEVRAIESIQTFVGWGEVERAAAALKQYRRRFPEGELALEADLLDVDVALARGDRALATRLASVLLDRPAASRYRARLETLAHEKTHAKPDAAGSIGRAGHIKERR
jgi:hypothetical protein